MNDIRKLHSILNEEDRNVIPDDIPIALLGIKFDSKSSHISNGIGASAGSENGGESEEDGCRARSISEHTGGGDICCAFVEFEGTESTYTSGMDNPFWDTLVVEFHNLVDVLAMPKVHGGEESTFSLAKLSSKSRGP
jgi:hypothetical protein